MAMQFSGLRRRILLAWRQLRSRESYSARNKIVDMKNRLCPFGHITLFHRVRTYTIPTT